MNITVSPGQADVGFIIVQTQKIIEPKEVNETLLSTKTCQASEPPIRDPLNNSDEPDSFTDSSVLTEEKILKNIYLRRKTHSEDSGLQTEWQKVLESDRIGRQYSLDANEEPTLPSLSTLSNMPNEASQGHSLSISNSSTWFYLNKNNSQQENNENHSMELLDGHTIPQQPQQKHLQPKPLFKNKPCKKPKLQSLKFGYPSSQTASSNTLQIPNISTYSTTCSIGSILSSNNVRESVSFTENSNLEMNGYMTFLSQLEDKTQPDPAMNDVATNTVSTKPCFEQHSLANHQRNEQTMQSVPMSLPQFPSIAQSCLPEVNPKGPQRSRRKRSKRLKTQNPADPSQPFSPMNPSLSQHPTKEDFENEYEDEYAEFQNEREERRNPEEICNGALNVQNGPGLDSAQQYQLTLALYFQALFAESQYPKGFVSVVYNNMLELFKDKKLGKGFRDAIKREKWFKLLVQRERWLRFVIKAKEWSKEFFLRFISSLPSCQEKISITECYENDFQSKYNVFLTDKDFVNASSATIYCEEALQSKGYQAAMQWKQLQEVIRKKKWREIKEKNLPQGECAERCQNSQCPECQVLENLFIHAYAIFKEGINEKGEVSCEPKSLRKLWKLIGNECFSESDHVIEMNLKEFGQKLASSLIDIILRDGNQFFETCIQHLYNPRRNVKLQSEESKALCDEKRKLYQQSKKLFQYIFAHLKNYAK